MYELQELRRKIETKDYQGALQIISELEEMSLEDKLNKIESYMVILLLHLIKQSVEDRTTSCWNRSISNSVKGINKTNKRRKSGGYYAQPEAIAQMLNDQYQDAIEEASYEAFEGKLNSDEIAEKANRSEIIKKAISLINENLTN